MFQWPRGKKAMNATTLDQMKDHEFYTAECNSVSLRVVIRSIAPNGGNVSVSPGFEAFGLSVDI